jgi:glycosyltransferase involved in cell wall biosynthesis
VTRNRFCIVVPHFNHHEQLQSVLVELDSTGLPVILVDDGSDEASLAAVERMTDGRPGVTLSRLTTNSGKGAAVTHGIKIARDEGFTHVIQIDADGQHCITDIPRLISESDRFPDSLVSGRAVFGETVPKSRLYGRRFTLWWTRLETISDEIEDAMCGFRVYPIAPLLEICTEKKIGRRMQFDVEILVRWIWAGRQIRYVATQVEYPEYGLSHFQLIRDNLQISLMHTKLVFGMLIRSPMLIRTRYQSKNS